MSRIEFNGSSQPSHSSSVLRLPSRFTALPDANSSMLTSPSIRHEKQKKNHFSRLNVRRMFFPWLRFSQPGMATFSAGASQKSQCIHSSVTHLSQYEHGMSLLGLGESNNAELSAAPWCKRENVRDLTKNRCSSF